MTFEEELHTTARCFGSGELAYREGARWAQYKLGWQSIETMPDNELVLLGIWVGYATAKKLKFETYQALYDPLDKNLYDINFEVNLPFEKEDFDYWMYLPDPPELNKKD